MGMNFYIRDRSQAFEKLTHIGKWSNEQFLWALCPEEFAKIFEKTPQIIIVNDSGTMNGYYSFMTLIEGKEWIFDHIGKEFC